MSNDLTPEQVEESIRFAEGASAAAGITELSPEVWDDARSALRGEISFDEAIQRALDRAQND